jgi:hypothetical protein
VEPGEFTPAGDRPALVVGDLAGLTVRAQVEERDAHRLRADSRGVACSPGQADRPSPLRLLRIEPLAVAKSHLTASKSEAVDMREIEVLFALEIADTGGRYFAGQIVAI